MRSTADDDAPWLWVMWLYDVIAAVIPLAASAQLGRCRCGRALDLNRSGWASPICYACLPADSNDRRKIENIEATVVLISRGVDRSCLCEPWGDYGPHICPSHESALYLRGYR
jgi:hypothetical protein